MYAIRSYYEDASDHSRGLEKTKFDRRHMETSTPPAVVAVAPTQDLGKHAAWLRTTRQDVTVVAMRCKNIIRCLQERQRWNIV